MTWDLRVWFLVRTLNSMSLNVSFKRRKQIIIIKVQITSMYAILIQIVKLKRGCLWKCNHSGG